MRLLRRVRYRFKQGILALLSRFRHVNIGEAAEVLSPSLLALFMRMRRAEQQHCLRVMRYLRRRGHTNPHLLTAALLHDVGKTRCHYTLLDRTLVVLMSGLFPRLAHRWGEFDALNGDRPHGWRRPFVVARMHSTWSAEDMLAAGASPMAVALACRHDEDLDSQPLETEEDRLLHLLQVADNQN
ncbi:MAG TPA: HD domain-containing protein [Aggregatilineales bacterium]|nr:HD domain-containing protein [Aggregatilineales bacterium]